MGLSNEALYKKIKRAISYNKRTGVYRWKIRPSQAVKAGQVAGSIGVEGYRYIKYDGKTYRATHIAWLLCTGRLPTHTIDHENRKPSDDRWKNLREATPTQNGCNRKGVGRSKVKGVRKHRCGRWEARIGYEGKDYYLGLHETKNAAAAVYAAKARSLHGEFAYVEAT